MPPSQHLPPKDRLKCPRGVPHALPPLDATGVGQLVELHRQQDNLPRMQSYGEQRVYPMWSRPDKKKLFSGIRISGFLNFFLNVEIYKFVI